VRAIERDTEADPAAILFSTLAMAGNLLGRHVGFQVEEDVHYANLYVALVGRSARGRKGVSRGRANRPFALADPVWAESRHIGGLGSGEGLINEVRDANPERNDPGAADKRLLAYEPELARLLAAMGREGNTLSALLREAWDGLTLHNTVKGSPLKATGAHVSALAHITQAELQRLLTATEKANGFGNRILWVSVERARKLPRGGRPAPTSVVTALAEAIKAARLWGQARTGQILTWDEAGGAPWDAAYPALTRDLPGLLGAITSRAEAQALRLSLLEAQLDRAEAVGRAHVEAALDLWGYCEDSAAYLFGDALGDPVADAILAALRRAGPEGLDRENLRDLFHRNRHADEIDRALELLERQALAARWKAASGGRPAERWRATQNDGNDENDETASAEEGAGGFCRLGRFRRTDLGDEEGGEWRG
jgi:hypothetical protein